MTVSWVRNGRLRSQRLVDVAVVGGHIHQVTDHDPTRTGGIDLAGWLLLPPMVEPHAHLDKALSAETVDNPTGDLQGAVGAWAAAAAAGRITPEDVMERADAALRHLVTNGVTAVRTHVNVTPEVGTTNLSVLRRVGAAFADLVDLQIVALTGAPMVGPDAAPARAALDAAVENGADVVGGCPHLAPGESDSVAHAFAVAEAAGLPVDLHTDETLDPAVLTVLDMAEQVESTGFANGVTASHCVSLGMQAPDRQRRIAKRLAAAGVAVLPQPQTNLYLQARDVVTAPPRGLSAVAALVDAGVTVAAGADNVQDPYNLLGRSDPLETASLLVLAAHVLPDDAYEMVSNNARRVMGLAPVDFLAGDPADFVAIDAPSVRAAIADAPPARRVFRRGRLIASSDQTITIDWSTPR